MRWYLKTTNDFCWRLKQSKLIETMRLSSREFQSVGPETENSWWPYMLRWYVYVGWRLTERVYIGCRIATSKTRRQVIYGYLFSCLHGQGQKFTWGELLTLTMTTPKHRDTKFVLDTLRVAKNSVELVVYHRQYMRRHSALSLVCVRRGIRRSSENQVMPVQWMTPQTPYRVSVKYVGVGEAIESRLNVDETAWHLIRTIGYIICSLRHQWHGIDREWSPERLFQLYCVRHNIFWNDKLIYTLQTGFSN